MSGKTDSLFEQVYAVVKRIPEGKVSTYGEVARAVGSKDARKVGWALHANKDSNTPCHRVVNKVGRLAPNFAFGGPDEQRKRLKVEGVVFTEGGKVDLDVCGFSFE